MGHYFLDTQYIKWVTKYSKVFFSCPALLFIVGYNIQNILNIFCIKFNRNLFKSFGHRKDEHVEMSGRIRDKELLHQPYVYLQGVRSIIVRAPG